MRLPWLIKHVNLIWELIVYVGEVRHPGAGGLDTYGGFVGHLRAAKLDTYGGKVGH